MLISSTTAARLSFAQMLVRAQRRFVQARQVIEAARPPIALSRSAGQPGRARATPALAARREPTLV